MRLDIYNFLISNKDCLIPAISFALLGLIISLVMLGLKEIYSRASAVVKFLMITCGIIVLIIIIISIITIYVFLLE